MFRCLQKFLSLKCFNEKFLFLAKLEQILLEKKKKEKKKKRKERKKERGQANQHFPNGTS